ncbi:FMN-binding protein [Thiohalophilus sp.]|uniref:FMN-binding protein n=1 Tax=Thiohalophilus sp. TaxID=3028392 RepID=UPI002ACEF764|nr:FMN-binding protein [Thiohalophilus sp.]MDZ7805168.1 FMN-binding protein [Thiohalophilus sp.]
MKFTIQLVFIFCAGLLSLPASGEVHQKPEAFLQQVFENQIPDPEMLWITGELRDTAEQILQHKPTSLRTRYWQSDQRTAWILEEIGKEQPITVGIVISDDRIETVKVLIFRESRGWEVKYPFFTNQFKQAKLDSELELNTDIDGITGATLSVRALTKLSRLALYFHQHVTHKS